MLPLLGDERTRVVDYAELREEQIDRLADALENALDMDRLLALLDPVRVARRSGA